LTARGTETRTLRTAQWDEREFQDQSVFDHFAEVDDLAVEAITTTLFCRIHLEELTNLRSQFAIGIFEASSALPVRHTTNGCGH
jgi:hypothetical protein